MKMVTEPPPTTTTMMMMMMMMMKKRRRKKARVRKKLTMVRQTVTQKMLKLILGIK